MVNEKNTGGGDEEYFSASSVRVKKFIWLQLVMMKDEQMKYNSVRDTDHESAPVSLLTRKQVFFCYCGCT